MNQRKHKIPKKKVVVSILIFFIVWFSLHTIVLLTVGLHDVVDKADVILIFGNTVETNGKPSERLQSRLDEGFELFNKGMAPLILVSGGIGKEGFDEADVMKKNLLERGVPENSVITDSNGLNTYLTAKNLKAIASDYDIEKVILVTNYYHVLRAELALHRFGFTTVYTSHAKMFPELRDFYSIPREIVGYYAYLFGNYTV